MLPYTTAEEFTQRLADCVILLDGAPIYVVSVLPDCQLQYYTLPCLLGYEHTVLSRIAGSDPRLTATGYRLGYCNPNGILNKAAYITRIPARQAKQGLYQSTVFVPPDTGLNWARLLSMQGMVDMLQGRYPSFTEAVEQVRGGRGDGTVAFGRRFAIEFSNLDVYYLHYRGRKIASGYEPNRFVLPAHGTYLRDIMQEQGLQVA